MIVPPRDIQNCSMKAGNPPILNLNRTLRLNPNVSSYRTPGWSWRLRVRVRLRSRMGRCIAEPENAS